MTHQRTQQINKKAMVNRHMAFQFYNIIYGYFLLR
jgi:hypothetical protein